MQLKATRSRPAVVSYAFRGCDWDVMDPALASFAKMPG
jgi:hypothetical protein